ncbi:TRAM domain-containing protein [Natrinema sp. SYSU A 869]|uniref:TRAM domain-containing protein n=1 Tax=Natrinema sp. SYSU A 869 TaxID=2871694 RepID=UPI001CA3FBDA|nr:TRAM domain-containing protein [Natrinema sp. SYSU A 869]
MAPIEPGDEYRIQITEFGAEGDGIGYIDGFVIVVPEAGIGQWVTITIDAVYENFALASVTETDLFLGQPPEA